jgi:hypothetical protein
LIYPFGSDSNFSLCVSSVGRCSFVPDSKGDRESRTIPHIAELQPQLDRAVGLTRKPTLPKSAITIARGRSSLLALALSI